MLNERTGLLLTQANDDKAYERELRQIQTISPSRALVRCTSWVAGAMVFILLFGSWASRRRCSVSSTGCGVPRSVD